MENKTKINSLQRFVMQDINRKEIKNAPYNPRIIDDSNRKKLQKSLKKLGLLEPLIVNKRNYNLVSGHQRISILDDINKSNDYILTFSVVDLTDKQEKEANIMLNNQSLQGEYDPLKLTDMFKEHGISFEETGFELNELNIMGVETDSIFENETEKSEKTIEEINKIRELKKNFRKEKNQENSLDGNDYYCVVVFKDGEHKNNFLEKIKIDKDTKYIKADILETILEKK